MIYSPILVVLLLSPAALADYQSLLENQFLNFTDEELINNHGGGEKLETVHLEEVMLLTFSSDSSFLLQRLLVTGATERMV